MNAGRAFRSLLGWRGDQKKPNFLGFFYPENKFNEVYRLYRDILLYLYRA